MAVHDGALLGVLQVEQEDGIEHPQHLAFVDVVGMQIADDFAHLRGQVPGGVRGQRLLRLVQVAAQYFLRVGLHAHILTGSKAYSYGP